MKRNLNIFSRYPEPHRTNARTISVVIPTLNEALYLDRALAPLRGVRNIETIVVDGGSHDGTDVLGVSPQTLSRWYAHGGSRW